MAIRTTANRLWVEVNGTAGTVHLPATLLQKEVDRMNDSGKFPRKLSRLYGGDIESVALVEGYGVSVKREPWEDEFGDWHVFDSKGEAESYAREVEEAIHGV